MAKTIMETLQADTQKALDEKIHYYFQQYNTLGYDTRIARSMYDEDNNMYRVVICRLDSCD